MPMSCMDIVGVSLTLATISSCLFYVLQFQCVKQQVFNNAFVTLEIGANGQLLLLRATGLCGGILLPLIIVKRQRNNL